MQRDTKSSMERRRVLRLGAGYYPSAGFVHVDAGPVGHS